MDLNSILEQLGVGSKDTVYLSVTPGVGLELIHLDISSRSVKNYSYRPLEYNEALNEKDYRECLDIIGLNIDNDFTDKIKSSTNSFLESLCNQKVKKL